MQIFRPAIAQVVIGLLVVTAAWNVSAVLAKEQAAATFETDTVRYPSGSPCATTPIVQPALAAAERAQMRLAGPGGMPGAAK